MSSVYNAPHLNRSGYKHRRYRSGITMIEIILSLFILGTMALMFSAIVPSALRSSRYTGSYSQALTICNRKMDQLLEAGFNRMDTTNLKSLGIIDSTAATVGSNAGGTTNTYYFTNNNTAINTSNPDNLLTYYPNGATGTIFIDNWVPGKATLNNQLQPMLYRATVKVTWRDAAGAQQSYSLTSLIPRMTAN